MDVPVSDVVPTEEETIAVRRSARIADKILLSRRRMFVTRSWWSNSALELLAVGSVIGLNIVSIWQFLGNATPSTAFSGPVIPLLAKAFAVFGFEFSYGLQLVNTFFYLGFTLAFYLLVKYISGRKLTGYLAVLIASLSVGPFAQSRIQMSFVGGETPHIASLTMVLLTLCFLLNFVRRGGLSNLFLNVLAVSVTALISPTGFLSLLVFSTVAVFSEMLLGSGRLKATRLFLVVVLAVGLTSFWYSPGFLYWMVMGEAGAYLRHILNKLAPVSLFAVPILAIFGFLLFDRKPGWQPFFVALFCLIAFTGITLVSGGLGSMFVSELGISLAFFLGVVVLKLFDYARHKNILWLKWAVWGGMAIIIISTMGAIGLQHDRVYEDDTSQVLGLWTNVQKDQIWVKRDEFLASPLSFFGTIISSATVIAILGIFVASSRKPAI